LCQPLHLGQLTGHLWNIPTGLTSCANSIGNDAVLHFPWPLSTFQRSQLITAPMPRSAFLFLVLFSVHYPSLSTADEDVSVPIIRHIHIEGNNRTRPETIQRELLFAVGDTLDHQQLTESERLLRRLFFLGEVSIKTTAIGNSVAVLVAVQDLYSRALSPLFSGEPGELSYGLIGLDYNFMGRGQTTRLTLEHQAVTGNQISILYQIPRLADSSRNLSASATIGSEGHDARIALTRPFRSLSAPWSYGLSLATQKSVQRLYSTQELVERYTDNLSGLSAWATHSRGEQTKWRPGVRLNISDRRFTATREFTYAPEDRRRILPSIGLTIWRPRYEKTHFYQTLGQTEDVQIGSWTTARVGLSHKSLGSDRSFAFYSAQLSPRLKPYAHGYVFLTFFISARQSSTNLENIYTLLQFQGHARWRLVHSLSLRLRWDAIHRFEDASQLLLGLNSGLRGYPPRRFDGTRRFLFNLEARPTFKRHPSYVLAGVFFVDGGTTWTPPLTSPNLKMSAGLGGRLGLPRIYNTPVMRADLAYAFADNSLQFSFGIGHFF